MAGNVNKVILVGRLGADPEKIETKTGTTLVHFPMATNSGFGDKESTDWHRVKAFGKTGDACARYLTKGQLCYLEGRVSYRRYEKDNQVAYCTEVLAHRVEFLGNKGERAQEAVKVHEDDEAFSAVIPF